MRSHLTPTLAAALSLVGSALIGPSAHAAMPDACRLLSPAEVGAAVGASMGAGAVLDGPTSSTCKWLQQGVDPFKAVTVMVSTRSVQAFETSKHVMSPTPVSGVGDEAYFSGKSLSLTVLSVKQGQNSLSVTVRGLKDVPALQAAEKALGKVAVGRLP